MSMIEERYCSLISAAAGEPMIGTASVQTTWLLLEYNSSWRRKAVTDNDLPSPVQAWLAATLAAIPGSRLIFIRRENRGQNTGLHFFVVDTDDAAPEQFRFLLPDYGALLALDIPTFLANQAARAAAQWPQPLYAVCTNGKRDTCCAKFGRPIYDTLAAAYPDQVWQCTHLGGHRYAGTMMAFPAGICYGRLNPDAAATVITAHERGEISLAYLRGRGRYEAAAQVAEHHLREQSGCLGLADFLHIETTQPTADEWLVTFGDRRQNLLHDIWLSNAPHSRPILKSCREEELVNVSAYSPTAWEAIRPQDIGIE